VYYGFHPERTEVALASLGTNMLLIGAMFVAFIVVGTALFVRAEQNR
jgi:hypothetical protein